MTDQSTYEILKNSALNKPRVMGTKGEEETTQFLLDFLKKQKLTPFAEEVSWSTAMLNGRKILFLLVGIFICLFNIFLWFLSSPSKGITSIVTAFFSFIIVPLFLIGIMNDKVNFLGKEAKGKNVICEIEPEKQSDKSAIIYLLAHSDSMTTNMPRFSYQFLFIMLFGFLLEVILTITSGIISLVIFYQSGLTTNIAMQVINIIILVVGIIILPIVITSLFVRVKNESPGACDNGSGSAILLSLATYFKNHSLKNTVLKIIWCTAEEFGLYGSKGYVKAHEDEIVSKKDNSYVINIDMVGSEIAYLRKTGLIRKKELNKKLNQVIGETAKEHNIKVREMNSWLASNTDIEPFRKLKMEVSSFTSLKDFKNVHSPKDTIDKVNPKKLEEAVTLLSKVIEKIDAN